MKRIVPVGLLLLLSACHSGSSTSLPTVPTALTTVTFTGTVNLGSSDFHTFTVPLSGGELDITLRAAGPPSTVFMGIYVGIPSTDGSTCTLINPSAFTVVQAGTTPQLSGTINAGTYCVAVYDAQLPGNQTAAVSYTVTVAHV